VENPAVVPSDREFAVPDVFGGSATSSDPRRCTHMVVFSKVSLRTFVTSHRHKKQVAVVVSKATRFPVPRW
jgi:hypothetical protein